MITSSTTPATPALKAVSLTVPLLMLAVLAVFAAVANVALAQTTKNGSPSTMVEIAPDKLFPEPAFPPIRTRPSNVSAALWSKITALKPGMTRADLLRVFDEEGGLSSRLHRIYSIYSIYSRQTTGGTSEAAKGLYLKINATFAPAGVRLVWHKGEATFRVPESRLKAVSRHENPDDVISSLSPVYWGYRITR